MRTVEERFWEKVERRSDSDCWPWKGASIPKDGRGTFWFKGRMRVAPAVSLELHGRPIPFDRAFACHHCDNPNCVNPAHLFWGTVRENVEDAKRKGRLYGQSKTHCLRGHRLSGDNLNITSQGRRQCRMCNDEHKRGYQAKEGAKDRRRIAQNKRRALYGRPDSPKIAPERPSDAQDAPSGTQPTRDSEGGA